MSPLGARRARREADEQARREEGMGIRPVERRFGRFPTNRTVWLCGPRERKTLGWTEEEALAALEESERGVLFRLRNHKGEPYNIYLINRRIYRSNRELPDHDLMQAKFPASPYLPIVQVEIENDEPHLGTSTYAASGRPQQLGEPPKFIPAADKRVRKPLPRDVLMFVWQRDQGRCVYCGSQERLEYDHIIPWADGGSDTARNLQLLCETCNRRKGRSI
jgi:hypothetical protein